MTRRLSLRARLLLAVAAITAAAFALADVAVYSSLRSYLDSHVDSSLEASHQVEQAMAVNPARALGRGRFFVPGSGLGPGAGAGARTGAPADQAGTTGVASAPLPLGTGQLDSSPGNGSAFCAIGREGAPGMFIEVLAADGEVVTGAAGREQCSSFQPGSASYSPRLPAVITGFETSALGADGEPTTYFTVGPQGGEGPSFRVRACRLPNGQVLVLAAPISSVTNTLSQLVVVELLVTAGAVLAAVLLGLWLVRVGLRPLREVQRTAEAISGGDLVHRVPNPNPRTEVGHMATAFNVMLGRIEELVGDLRASEGRLRRFVGDASHELRTPIAAVSAYAQLFDQGASSRPQDLQRAMDGIRNESARMSRLVEDLLTLARLDEHRRLETEPVEMVGLALEARDTALLVGPQWPVGFAAREAAEVVGDRGALRQVVDNLLANVRGHTPPGTRATLSVARAGSEVVVEVADDGPGITAEQARAVFERFFRVDPSRSRRTGGAGLGLAIVASIVEAHGGWVEAAPGLAGGAVFRVHLPALEGGGGDGP